MTEDQDRGGFVNKKPSFIAPKRSLVVPIVNVQQKNQAIEAARDLSQARKLTHEEHLAQVAAKKAEKRAEKKAAKDATKVIQAEKKAKEAKDKPKLLFPYVLINTNGTQERGSLELKSSTCEDGYSPAGAAARLLTSLTEHDGYACVRIERGVFLVVYFQEKDGERTEIHWCFTEEKAQEHGIEALSEGAIKFTVSKVAQKREVLLRAKMPVRDEVKKSRNRSVDWVRKTKPGWKMRAKQDTCHFSHG